MIRRWGRRLPISDDRRQFPQASLSRGYAAGYQEGYCEAGIKSRLKAGIVEFEHHALNQLDEIVATCCRAALMHKRQA